MTPHELVLIAEQVGLRNPRVAPWKLRGDKSAYQLVWGPDDGRWSLLIPEGATIDDVRVVFMGVQARTGLPTLAQPTAPLLIPTPATPLQPQPEGPPSPPRRQRVWSVADLLNAAAAAEPKGELPAPELPPPAVSAPPLMDDTLRKRAAKELVQKTAEDASRGALDLQMRYEMALQAHNGNVQIIEMMEPEARATGISVADLAERIITDRQVRQRRMSHVYEIKALALAKLEQAAGEDAIAAIERQAVQDIRGVL